MKTIHMILLAALIALPLSAGWAQDRSDVTAQGRLDVDVWTDNNDGVYYEGDNIKVLFQTSQDCFVAIYSVDTRGNVNMLFPADPRDDGFVRAGDVYAIPSRYDDYDLYVTGPEGIEYIQAIASESRMDVPDWYGGAAFRCDYYNGPEECLDYINDRFFNNRWNNRFRAFDRMAVYVKSPGYYYRPVYVPHGWYAYPNYAMVYIDYPFGAEVYFDGIFFGIAPLWVPRVIIGWHWITIYDRYGYCWEDHIDFQHNHTIHLDHTRIKTSRTVLSRFKDVRVQAKKYSKTDLVLSEERVKSTRMTVSKETSKRNPLGDYRTKRGDINSPDIRSKRDAGSTAGSTPDRTRGSDGIGDRRANDAQERRGDYKGTESPRKAPAKIEGTDKSKRSPESTVDKQSQPSKRSGDSIEKPSKRQEASPEGKSSSSRSGGYSSKPSGSRGSSSVGRSTTGRSGSGASSSGTSSSSKGSRKR